MPKSKRKRNTWPADMDPECIPLCEALNMMPGIRTYSSCCGHGRGPFTVYSFAYSWAALERIAWPICHGHSLQWGWTVGVRSRSIQGYRPTFYLEGKHHEPMCVYAEANLIAPEFREFAKQLRDGTEYMSPGEAKEIKLNRGIEEREKAGLGIHPKLRKHMEAVLA